MVAESKATMICPKCDLRCASFGKHRNGLRRFRCGQCGKTYTEPHEQPLCGMTLETEKAVMVLKLLVEGASVRSTERVTGVHRDTILKLLVLVGEKCEKLMGRLIVNVPCRDVECDEIWAYVGKKEGHKAPAEAHDSSIGDQYYFALGSQIQTATEHATVAAGTRWSMNHILECAQVGNCTPYQWQTRMRILKIESFRQ